MLKSSCIPARPQRQWRDLARHRTPLVEERTRTVNRIHNVLQDAHIQLASVASDIPGASNPSV